MPNGTIALTISAGAMAMIGAHMKKNLCALGGTKSSFAMNFRASATKWVMPQALGRHLRPGSAMYARFVPTLHHDAATHGWIGGLFWDGRASSLEQQAGMPMLHPLEMNSPDKASVVRAIRRAGYAGQFRAVFGADALDDVDAAFGHVTEVVAAYERTAAFAPFSSKYDRYLAGQYTQAG